MIAAPAAPACKEAIVENKVVQDVVIAPDENWSAVLTPGQVLRIVDLEGKQAVDFLCYNADDPADRYNAADTMKYNKNAYLGAGHGIYTVRATKLFTIVADTMGGGHDTIGGCCSAASNMFRYKVPDTPSCYANFLRALRGRQVEAGRLRGAPRRDARPRGGLELPAGAQPMQRVQPHADPRGDHQSRGVELRAQPVARPGRHGRDRRPVFPGRPAARSSPGSPAHYPGRRQAGDPGEVGGQTVAAASGAAGRAQVMGQ